MGAFGVIFLQTLCWEMDSALLQEQHVTYNTNLSISLDFY